MKGKVFIAWSAINEHTNKNELAIAVREKLEQYDYIGIVGGQSRTDSGLHVGEAVIKELDQCNQDIFIMQKKENGVLSNNLMFELGYALSRFNSNKIHVFYIDIAPEDQTIPSDIKGIWANYMTSARSEDMATEIVEEFISNQKNIIPHNKMALVDSYYSIKEKISEYPYSPGYSEYEFAQFILFFSQSGYMFRNERESINILKNFVKVFKNPTQELIIMGGCDNEEPNFGDYEFNHCLDPEAFSYCTKFPHAAITLDTCRVEKLDMRKYEITGDDFHSQILRADQRLSITRKEDGCYVWDDVAASYLIFPERFELREQTDPHGNRIFNAVYISDKLYFED